MPNWELPNTVPLLRCTKRWRKKSLPPWMWGMSHGLTMTASSVVSDNKIEYVMDWPKIPNTWPKRIRINISWDKVLAQEYAMFQLQKKKAFSPCWRLSTIGALFIHRSHFCVPLNHDAHATSRISKIMHRNLSTQQHTIKTNGTMTYLCTYTISLESLSFCIHVLEWSSTSTSS